MQAENSRPLILVFAGLDPSGGAGLQADIEAISHCGGHALPIASCLTVQNTQQADAVCSVDQQLIQRQVNAILQDMRISACKIGVIPSQSVAVTIAEVIAQFTDIPIIFDPVLTATNGITFSDRATIQVIQKTLLPRVTVMTPNTQELNTLIDGKSAIAAKAQALCAQGPQYVLVTGAEENTRQVKHLLFNLEGLVASFACQRLPHSYHGSGCTLSSALATWLAMNLTISEAIKKAQRYTWLSLQHAEPLGAGQWIPNRNSKQI